MLPIRSNFRELFSAVLFQNIDTLERRAGIQDDFLVEAHGAFHTAHCIDCGLEHQHEYVRGKAE